MHRHRQDDKGIIHDLTSAHVTACGPRQFVLGALTMSVRVERAMLRSRGSSDEEFIETVKEIRECLLRIAGASDHDYTGVIMRGCGTVGLEGFLSSAIPRGGQCLLTRKGA